MPTAARETMEAGGILKFGVMFKFKVAACLVKKVEVCAKHTPNGSAVSHMGIMMRISFTSSTFVTVANIHGFFFFCSKLLGVCSSSSTMAALSRNLQIKAH